MKDANPDDRWDDRARLLRVMAHPVRLMILEALCERTKCVKDINSLIPIVQPHLSQHIGALRRAELIDCHAAGPMRCYYLTRPTLVKRLIRLLAQDHPVRVRDSRSVVREASCNEPGESGSGDVRKAPAAPPKPAAP